MKVYAAKNKATIPTIKYILSRKGLTVSAVNTLAFAIVIKTEYNQEIKLYITVSIVKHTFKND